MHRYVLPGQQVFPEGITEGPGSTFFVGSLGDETIFRGDTATGAGIVAHPGEPLLLAAAQGEGVLWRIDLADAIASPVDLDGYEFTADGMLADGDVLYGVTNRGENVEDAVFMVSAARLAPDWRSGAILGELTDEVWDFPTTIAKVGGQMLVVCS
ncbi:MAG: hypothetical protein ACYCVZ_04220 [Streptosporangiaceae bacterium]